MGNPQQGSLDHRGQRIVERRDGQEDLRARLGAIWGSSGASEVLRPRIEPHRRCK